jgi:hypothetical protein
MVGVKGCRLSSIADVTKYVPRAIAINGNRELFSAAAPLLIVLSVMGSETRILRPGPAPSYGEDLIMMADELTLPNGDPGPAVIVIMHL